MLEVMRCLDEELRMSPAPDSKAYKVIRVLLDASLKALEKGNEDPQTFDRATLLALCEPKLKATGRDPARWITLRMLEVFLDGRMNSIMRRAEYMGLKHLPVIASSEEVGGAGKPRIFWLATTPLETRFGVSMVDKPCTIVYSRTEEGEVKPTLFLRVLFRNGVLPNRSWRGGLLLTSIVLGVGFWLLWIAASIFSLSEPDQPLTLRQLVAAVVVLLMAWFMYSRLYQPWVDLVLQRVVKAPELLLSINEQPAELEMYRDDAMRPWTRFVRFSSDCPICGGRVLLADGKPDHKMPLVGRCSESPHVHVFSFDRARLSGVYVGPGVSQVEAPGN